MEQCRALRPGVADGCRTTGDIDVSLRRDGITPAQTVATDRFVDAASPIALTALDSGWALAYWRESGSLALLVLDSAFQVRVNITVPGPSFAWAEVIPGPIALARTSDGTLAIAWSTSGGVASGTATGVDAGTTGTTGRTVS